MEGSDPIAALATRAGQTQQASPAASQGNELGQDTFLELMTTQLQNQDPLDPKKNAQFVGQLAQFGTVNGISDLQESFEGLRQSLAGNDTLKASRLIGREVLAPAQQGVLTGDNPVRGAVEVPEGAQAVTVTVTDPAGNKVRELELGPSGSGLAEFRWDGISDGGANMPPDTYGLRAEVQTDSGLSEANVLVSDQVRSVTPGKDANDIDLGLENLGSVGFDNIRRVSADG